MAARFAGRVSLVTGGANGLGRAIVAAFLEEGARVGILDLEEAGAFAGRDDVLTLVGDVADPQVAAGAVAATVERFGGLDILVNDAAAYPDGSIVNMPVDEWRRVFEVNVTGAFATIQAFARHVSGRERDGASIVNITTGSVRSPRPDGAAYSASKAALETLSKVAAMELGPRGIRVNAVAPGLIATRLTLGMPSETRDWFHGLTPLGVFGAPEDVADVIAFLASGDARYVTGVCLPVDGGMSLGLVRR